jgi:hypothetical protein
MVELKKYIDKHNKWDHMDDKNIKMKNFYVFVLYIS